MAASEDSIAISTLIALYFDCELPAERDAVFEQLAAGRDPQIDAFLRAMMLDDADPYLRLAAAAQLAGRGEAAGLQALHAALGRDDDETLFSQAVDALVQLDPAGAATALAAVWDDPARRDAQRRLSLLGLERADGPAAVARCWAELDRGPQHVPLELLDAMLAVVVRRTSAEALPRLEALARAASSCPLADEDDREALVAVCVGALTLLRAANDADAAGGDADTDWLAELDPEAAEAP